MIRFEAVSKEYPDGTKAVDELTFEAPTGQITVLVGPSGCGKTTSLRMINRMIRPTGGRILVDDQDTVVLRVVEQGGGAESRRVEDGKVIAEVSITDIPPGHPAGTEVQVTLAMGFDGILQLTATHQGVTDRPLTVRVETSAALSQSDVARERAQVAKSRRRT